MLRRLFRALCHATAAVVLVIAPTLVRANDATERKPVAEILGRAVYADELVPARLAEMQHGKLPEKDYAAWLERTPGEALRARVWSAVFADFAKQWNIEPTAAEIESHIRGHRRMRAEGEVQRQQERERLAKELKSPDLSEPKRKQAQQYLDTLDKLNEYDAKLRQERRDPEREKIWQESERRVAEHWVKGWKLNQALYREFGGRIVFQQAGWEPIDAYRQLLDRYAARKAFVVHDAKLREAVYSYFKHNFVYADEAKAKFYFEKPYWERNPEEIKAAGF
jgi:hypothetical protein